MIKFIISRLLGAIPVLLIIASMTFFMVRLAPGGPLDQERAIPPEVLKNIEAKYHLDWPMWKQYLHYMGPFNMDDHGPGFVGGDGTQIWGGMLTGDLGPSFKYANRSVNEIIRTSFPVSFELGIWGMIFALLIGCSAGMVASLYQGTWKDHLPMGLAMTGICTPNFVLGPILVLFFALYIPIFNVAGWNTAGDRILPAITLGSSYAAYIARLMRGGMLDILQQDFIRTARAKGLAWRDVLFKHALRGGILPTVSFLGPAASFMLAGSLVVELIFNIPGLGRHFIQGALNRDYTLVMGTAIFYAVIIIALNIIVDIVYAFLDPRVRYDD